MYSELNLKQQQSSYFGEPNFNDSIQNFMDFSLSNNSIFQQQYNNLIENKPFEQNIYEMNNNYNSNSSFNNNNENQQDGKYSQKIEELQNGIEEMKQVMNQYAQQLKEMEEIKSSQQSSHCSLDKELEQISEEQVEEQKIEELKQQVIQQRKKPVQKKKKVFKCQEANCSFESHKKIEVSRHVRKCHNYFGIELNFSCRFCQQKFHIDEARLRHEKVYHKNEIQQQEKQIEEISHNNLSDDSLFDIEEQVSVYL